VQFKGGVNTLGLERNIPRQEGRATFVNSGYLDIGKGLISAGGAF
jgi:hypothetical protein